MARTFRSPRTLRTRIVIPVAALLLTAAVTFTLLITHLRGEHAVALQTRAVETALRAVEPALRAAVRDRDTASLERLIGELAGLEGVARLRLSDTRGVTIFERARADDAPSIFALAFSSGADARELTQAIGAGGPPLGTISAYLASAPVNAAVATTFWVAAPSTLLAALLLIAAANLGLRRLTAPLLPLTQWAREIARGNWRPNIGLLPSPSRDLQELNEAMTAGCAAVQHYIRSLSEARELWEHSEQRLRHLVNGMQEILFELDAEGRLIFLNPAWERLTGFSIEQAMEKCFADYIVEEDVARDFRPAALARLAEQGREIAMRTASGKPLWVSLDAKAQFDARGELVGVIGTLDDITRSVELNRLLAKYQDDLYHMSVTDPLTALYNRRHFDTQLEVILADHLPHGRSVCLLLIDLDGFKFINDTYGHPFGDEVLRTTASLLRELVRRNDYIARLAGDEFAMVLKNTQLADATRIAQKVHGRINQTRVPLPVGHLQLQSSIGIAEAPMHGENAQDLVSAADVALYHSKRGGRNRIEVLSPDTSRAVMSIFSQGFELRNALEQGNICPVYQPIFDMRNGQPVAWEVLARMRHKDSLIKAQDFITVAGELGLTRDVDLHIIRSALAATPPGHVLFLNIDLSSFSDREYVRELGILLKDACDQGRRITLEITERDAVPTLATLHDDIQYLRGIGCKLALDDFGSGYSTYNFLNRFRPDYLKIEGSFVRGMLTSEADHKIVAHIHELAQSFGMETIAESVENQATQDALQAIGIRNAQGWFYGQPHLAFPEESTL